MPIRPADPFGGFLAGRAARQDEEYANTRNKLAQLEAEQYPQQVAQQNRLAGLRETGLKQEVDGRAQEAKQQAYQQIGALAQQALQSGDPRSFVANAINNPAYAQIFAQAQVDPRQIDLNSPTFDRDLQAWASFSGSQEDPRMALEVAKLQQGQSQFDTRAAMDRERLAFDREKFAADQNKPAGQFRPLTPQEVQQANLPAGTSAQIGPDGKIDVLSKRDNTGVLSQKDATTAKMKLTTVKLARKQLADIRNAFTKGTEGINAFGPGQGMLPTQAGKKFDAAVDRMRSTLTALTRVPGVGAMSDYETKLDQAKFPSRNAYESVTSEQIQGIEDMLALIENGYTGLLGGGSEQAPQAAAQAKGPRRVKVDAQGNVIGN